LNIVAEYFDELQDVKITKEMLDLAKHIVEQKSGHFDPDRFEDHYEAALQELLNKKQMGLPIEKAARQTTGNVINIMDALRESLKLGNASGGKPASSSGRRRPLRSARRASHGRPCEQVAMIKLTATALIGDATDEHRQPLN